MRTLTMPSNGLLVDDMAETAQLRRRVRRGLTEAGVAEARHEEELQIEGWNKTEPSLTGRLVAPVSRTSSRSGSTLHAEGEN